MATFELWDIIKVPFPYTNRPVQQFRPTLVVARSTQAGSPDLLWVLMITSASHRRWFGDVEISDLRSAGLSRTSVVRSVKIATVEPSGAERIGVLQVGDRHEVRTFAMDLLTPLLAAS